MRLMICCVFLLMGVQGLAAAPATQPDTTVPGNTYPSKYLVNLKFQMPGLIEKLGVKPGQTVKPGDELVKLDTKIEEQELKVLEIDTSNLPIEAAQKDAEVKQHEFDFQDEALKRTATSVSEWRKTKAELELAKLRVDKAKLDKQQAELKVAKQKEKIRQMTMVSQVEGVVEKVDFQQGEVVDPSKAVLTIAVNSPLWVEMRLPTKQAQMLSVGQELKVRYEDEGPEAARPGKIIYRGVQADVRADRQLVRIEWENPKGRDAGLRVLIELPADVAGAMNKSDRPVASGVN